MKTYETKMKKLGRLYAITDPVLTPDNKILFSVEQAIKGGVDVVQFRDKVSPTKKVLQIAKDLKKLCDDYNVPFIINDNPYLAKEISADGVHIGKDDIDFLTARKIVGDDSIIGVSCYFNVELAKYYYNLGANYLAFGSVFKSPTKPESEIGGLNIADEIKKNFKIPFYAIGGITINNVKQVLENGFYGVAVISGIFGTDNILQTSKKFKEIINIYPWDDYQN